ncbi:synaptic glycoprotein SC2 [Hypomontagnella monticulosa]|nr:synaptic glycoprotein SC2 [Hypomontagnella monticulosa]
MVSSISLNIKHRGKRIKTLPSQVTLQASDSTASLYQQVASLSHVSVHRLRLSLNQDGSEVVPNTSEDSLASKEITDDMDVFVKDLGAQIDWRTVYVIEYLGPLIIHPLLFNLRLASPSSTQTLVFYMVMGQFLKRELESLFVHRFSNATMPLRNIFKNSFHYWILSGVFLAWVVYTPKESTPATPSPPSLLTYASIMLYLVGLSMNTYVHLVQRSLRPAGTTRRMVPRGIGFAWVTCPNYMFETLTWVGVLVVSRSWSVLLFIVISVAQMKAWADKKEARYRKEFPGEYDWKKYSIIPGVM